MEKLYTINEASEHLIIHRNTVLNMIKDGRIEAVKIGTKYVIKESEVARIRGDEDEQKFVTKSKKITGANIVRFTVGFDNVSSGDSASTQLAIDNLASTSWHVHVDGENIESPCRLSIMLRGSEERRTFIEGLEFMVRQLKANEEANEITTVNAIEF